MSSLLVQVKNLTKKFDKKTVIKSINIDIKKGETLAIIGYSGCGKTTLLRIIGGFEKPTSGSVFMDEKEVIGPSRNSIMVGQEHNQLFPWKTALENVTWVMMATGIMNNKKEVERIAKRYLKELDIRSADYDKYPAQLSGGMKQRITIARALALRPSILLLDEPFGSLDDLTRRKVQDVVKDACTKNNVTVILVTHNISEAIKMADKILVFEKNGKTSLLNNNKNIEKQIEQKLGIK